MEPLSSRYKNFLFDLGPILKDRALETKKERDLAPPGSGEREFLNGILMGFHEVISTLQQQADAFQIDRRELRLDDVQPDRDLL